MPTISMFYGIIIRINKKS